VRTSAPRALAVTGYSAGFRFLGKPAASRLLRLQALARGSAVAGLAGTVREKRGGRGVLLAFRAQRGNDKLIGDADATKYNGGAGND
jgi:hypothetical protein